MPSRAPTSEVLVATSRRLFRVDLETSRATVVDEGFGLYFGITWDSERVYVAARWYPALMPTSAIERPRLLVFDSDLRLMERRRFPLETGGLHQIFFHDGQLFCSCSREDSYAIGCEDRWSLWYPSPDPRHRGRDVHHFNSVWIDDDRLFLLGHNNGPSDIWEMTYPGRRLVRKYRIGHTAHNVWRERGALAVCNSSGGTVETVDGSILCTTGGFPRGAAIGTDCNVIGISSVANRSNRWLTSGKIHVYDKAWQLRKEISLGFCGQVNDIRILGEDAAHNSLLPPLRDG